MAFLSTQLFGANFTSVDTTPAFALGTKTTGVDSSYGAGEFVYLKGVANTAAGSVVIFDNNAKSTTLATAGSRGPVAVALAATVASTYGWYQIDGVAVVTAGTVLAQGKVYATATAGSVDDAVVAGDKIDGAIFKTADGTPAAGSALVQMTRPCMNGNG